MRCTIVDCISDPTEKAPFSGRFRAAPGPPGPKINQKSESEFVLWSCAAARENIGARPQDQPRLKFARVIGKRPAGSIWERRRRQPRASSSYPARTGSSIPPP